MDEGASKSDDGEKQQVEPSDIAQKNTDDASEANDSKDAGADSGVTKPSVELSEDKIDSQLDDATKSADISSSKSDGNGPDAESPIRLTLEEEESFHDEEVCNKMLWLNQQSSKWLFVG